MAGFPTSQTAVDDAYRRARQCKHAVYVFGSSRVDASGRESDDLTAPYEVTERRPSRFRSHYRVDPDGRLWEYRTPRLDGVACADVPEDIKYTEIC